MAKLPEDLKVLRSFLRFRIRAAKQFKMRDYESEDSKVLHDRGVFFQGCVDPTEMPQAAKAWRRRFRPKPKDCYHNAQRFMQSNAQGAILPSAEYYEGFALTYFESGQADFFHHAWVVHEGKVLDFTTTANAYIGVPVPRDFICKHVAKTMWWAPVAHHYHLSLGTAA